MKTIAEKISQANSAISEMESYFKIQDRYFAERSEQNLMALRAQASKVKELIKTYKSQ